MKAKQAIDLSVATKILQRNVLWAEIKAMEQEYKRNMSQIKRLQDDQSDLSARISIKMDKAQSLAEKIDYANLEEQN